MFLLKKIQYNAPVILTYTLFSLVILGISFLTNGGSNRLFFSVYRASFTNPLTYVRLFTHVAGHVDLNHFCGNFLLILLIGPMLEEKYGSRALLLMMGVTAAITGGVFILISGSAMLLGASGVVFMMILLSSYVNLKKGRIPLTLLLVIVVFIGQEAVQGVTAADNISHLSHIIGGLCGAALGYFMNRGKLEGNRAEAEGMGYA
ncbi:MAG: rhomboid family intramembrane serine protease [Clostridiales bacterium]|nr:rhomboid family intramembrane serine protease [Clostridiales bacterium]